MATPQSLQAPSGRRHRRIRFARRLPVISHAQEIGWSVGGNSAAQPRPLAHIGCIVYARQVCRALWHESAPRVRAGHLHCGSFEDALRCGMRCHAGTPRALASLAVSADSLCAPTDCRGIPLLAAHWRQAVLPMRSLGSGRASAYARCWVLMCSAARCTPAEAKCSEVAGTAWNRAFTGSKVPQDAYLSLWWLLAAVFFLPRNTSSQSVLSLDPSSLPYIAW